jgi:O-antigen/teichoic acid export membrane protein
VSRSIAKNSVFTLLANLSLATSNWLLLVIITKYFSAYTLGEVVLSLSVLSPLFLLSSFKLRTLLVVDIENEYSIQQYFNARLMANTVALMLVPLLWWLFLSDVTAVIFLIVALYRWFDAWCELSYSYLHRINRFSFAAKSQCLRSVISISALLISSIISHNILIPLLSWMLVTASFAFHDVFRVRALQIAVANQMFSIRALVFSGHMYRTSLKIFQKYYTVSLALMLVSLYVFIPNIVLKSISGIEAAGQFAVVSYFLVAGSVIMTSMSQAASPHLSRLLHSNQINEFFKLAIQLCCVGLVVGAAALLFTSLFGEWLLGFVYNEALSQFSVELNWIMAAAMIRYSYIFLGTAMNSFKMFSFQTQIYFVGTASVLILCLILVPSMGTKGAAIAMFSATCIEMCLFILRFYSIRKTKLPNGAMI